MAKGQDSKKNVKKEAAKSPKEKKDINTDKLSQDIGNMSKEEAENLLNKLINDNKNDAKIVKDLMPQLTALKSWKGEKVADKSNITIYELPKKAIDL